MRLLLFSMPEEATNLISYMFAFLPTFLSSTTSNTVNGIRLPVLLPAIDPVFAGNNTGNNNMVDDSCERVNEIQILFLGDTQRYCI